MAFEMGNAAIIDELERLRRTIKAQNEVIERKRSWHKRARIAGIESNNRKIAALDVVLHMYRGLEKGAIKIIIVAGHPWHHENEGE